MRALDAWLFGRVPARRLAVVRVATFAYATIWLLVRLPYVLDVADLPARRFEAIGVLWWMDSPAEPSLVMAAWALATVACCLAAAGVGYRSSAPVGTLALLAVTTYTNSFGQVFHTENLLVLHCLILAAAPADRALTVPRRRRRAEGSDPDPARSQVEAWPLRLMALVVVIAYLLAGLAKLRYGGWDWLFGDDLRNQVAYDNLRKILVGDVHSPVGGRLAGVSWIWPPVAMATVLVELGAPLALLPGRIRVGWVAIAWSFHLGVLALMAILFPYQLTGVAYLSLVRAERLADLVPRLRVPRPGGGARVARQGMA